MSKRPQKKPKPESTSEPGDREEFEEFVDALLKVDPKGLSGKHRSGADDVEDSPSSSSDK